MEEQKKDYDKIWSISLNQINVFLTAARCENFSRAARELYTTQNYISKSISNLEAKIGVTLFKRHLSYVTLTEGGKNLYNAWQRALENIISSIEVSKEIQEKSFDKLRIGDNSELKGNIYLAPIVQKFKMMDGRVKLKYNVETLAHLVEDLISEKYDLIFCSALQIPELVNRGMDYSMIFPDKVCITVGKEHALAQRSHLQLQDLLNETIIVVSQENWPEYKGIIERLFKNHGLRVPEIQEVDNTHAAFIETLCCKGVLIADRMFYPSYEGYLKRYDIEGEQGGVVAAWNRENKNPYIYKLLTHIHNCLS